MIPRIPEGNETFMNDKSGTWYRLEQGGLALIDLETFHQYGARVRSNICNAARCAWLDEAENILHRQHRPVIAMYRYWDGLTYWESGITDPVRLQYREWPAWEIDYAHCLAHAEAWAREAKG